MAEGAIYGLSDLPVKIRSRIIVNPWTGCWEYQPRKPLPEGAPWAYVTHEGRTGVVHRFAYESLVGPIPEGLTIDHVYAWGCRSHTCCWPVHHEVVGRPENSRRGAEATIYKGVRPHVQRRLILGGATERDLALADALWMLPLPRLGERHPS